MRVAKSVSGRRSRPEYNRPLEARAILRKNVLLHVLTTKIVTLHHVQGLATVTCHSIVMKKVVVRGGLHTRRKRLVV